MSLATNVLILTITFASFNSGLTSGLLFVWTISSRRVGILSVLVSSFLYQCVLGVAQSRHSNICHLNVYCLRNVYCHLNVYCLNVYVPGNGTERVSAEHTVGLQQWEP